MDRAIAGLLGALFISGFGRPVLAQTPAPADVRLAVGVVNQDGLFGDDDPERNANVAPVIGFEMRRHPDRRIGVALEIAMPARSLQNPHIDERIRGLFVLAGPEIGQRVFGRLMAGGVVGMASGRDAEFVFGPAFGVAFGAHLQAGNRLTLTPEVVARAGGGVGAAAWMWGAQVAIGLNP